MSDEKTIILPDGKTSREVLEEQTKRANQHSPVNPTRGEIGPARGQEILLQ